MLHYNGPMLIGKNAKFYEDNGKEIPCERVSLRFMEALGIRRESSIGTAVSFEGKATPDGLEFLRKSIRPTFTMTLDDKMPGVKKGETLTLTLNGREMKGEL